MKPFHFSLDRVLEHRGWKLDQAERQLAEARSWVLELEQRLRNIVESRLGSGRDIADGNPVRGSDLRALGGYRHKLNRDEGGVQQKLQEAQGALERCRQLYHIARREHRLLEELRNRRVREWAIEADRDAERQSTDLFLSRWGGKKRR